MGYAVASVVALRLVTICWVQLLMTDLLFFGELLPLVLDFVGLVLPLLADDLGDIWVS